MISPSQYKKSKKKHATFTLQWHLTAQCSQNCVHCYIGQQDESYWQEIYNELDFDSCIKVIDDFAETFHRLDVPTHINFTGGDPLFKKGILDLIQHAYRKGIGVGILGNPNLLNERSIQMLKNAGVTRYQLSLDGGEETHDTLHRKKGLFKDTIRAIHLLENAGIRSVVMFTLHKLNVDDLIQVIHLVAKEGVSVFDFARLVPWGNAKDLEGNMLDPQEYRQLLLRVLIEYEKLQNQEVHTKFGRKDHLWRLLYYEQGMLTLPTMSPFTIYGGCGIGSSILVVLADGRVLPCRRLPIEIGRVPDQSLWEIFIESQELNKMRQVEDMTKCGKCDLLYVCRGCPAVPYATCRDYFAPDPQCWKDVGEMTPHYSSK